MIKIDVKKYKNLEHALKIYKSKVISTGLINEVRERKEFVKPSAKKRKQKEKAIYSQKYRDKNGLN